MLKNVQEPAERIVANVERVIVGKHAEVRLAMVALLCEGHILIEDVPGVGKTMLAKAISRSIGCTFRRIQFTPDLLPSRRDGPIDLQPEDPGVRVPPGTDHGAGRARRRDQPRDPEDAVGAARMHGGAAGHDRWRHPRDADPFLVMATQNPIEYEGTFALPEAQLDRFMLRLRMGYPKAVEEIVILDEQKRRHPIDELRQVIDAEELHQMQMATKEIYVDQAIAEYIVRLTGATREHGDVYLGASPRGSINLYRAVQATAALDGRDYAIPDDVKQLAVPILAHRLIVKSQASLREVDPDAIVREVLAQVPVADPSGATV